MSQDCELSRIGVSFGEDFEGKGKTSASVKLVINGDQTKERVQKLEAETSNQFDTLNFCALFRIEGGDNNELKDLIQQLTQQEDSPFKQELLFRDLKKLTGVVKFDHIVNNDIFYLRVSPLESTAEEYLEPFSMLLESGLFTLASSQTNSLEAKVCLNLDANQIIEKIQSGDRALVPFLSQAKADILLKLNKNLSTSLNDLVNEIDESLVSSPQMLLLKYFKNVDAHFSFDSAEDLPEVFRQKVLPGKNSEETSDKRKIDLQEKKPFLDKLIKAIGKNIQIDVIVEEFAHLTIEMHAPSFSVLLLNYFGYILSNI